jgi:signal transduction histidine kinase
MFSRFGLRFRMAASYVAVSALAFLVVEAGVLVIASPQTTSSVSSTRRGDVSTARIQAQAVADGDAKALSVVAGATAAGRRMSDEALLAATAGLWADQLGRRGLAVPNLEGYEALATSTGSVIQRSAATPALTDLPKTAVGATPASGTSTAPQDLYGWAASPITVPGKDTSPAAARHVIGFVYTRFTVPRDSSFTKVVSNGNLGIYIWAAVLVLILLLPLGVLFGLLSTRRLITRIQRLAAEAAAMASGNLKARVPVSDADEVGVLETGFNQMVEKLEAASQRERDAASAEARLTERNRIARELHDSISQNLFSLSMVSGNLRRTLPEGSRFREQADTMVRTIDHTMREMRAMLLELRPAALEQAGLVAALTQLCRSYEVRLGIRITAELDDVPLEPAAEHTLLRVAQEALSNAARHGQAESITVALRADGTDVVLEICDDGRGFDPGHTADRHGLGLSLMHERAGEVGGEVAVLSETDRGTTVRVRIPGGQA